MNETASDNPILAAGSLRQAGDKMIADTSRESRRNRQEHAWRYSRYDCRPVCELHKRLHGSTRSNARANGVPARPPGGQAGSILLTPRGD